MPSATAIIVRRPDWIVRGRSVPPPHPYGAEILDGPEAGAVYCLTDRRGFAVGAEVTVEFEPADQFATIVEGVDGDLAEVLRERRDAAREAAEEMAVEIANAVDEGGMVEAAAARRIAGPTRPRLHGQTSGDHLAQQLGCLPEYEAALAAAAQYGD